MDDAGPQVRLVQWLRAAQPLHVFADLLEEDVGGVVGGDDAEQPVLVVHDRQGEVVVLVEQSGGLFLVGVSADADDVGVHELRDRLPARREHQVAQRQHPEQSLGGRVGDVDVVDRLGLFGHAAELGQRLAGR